MQLPVRLVTGAARIAPRPAGASAAFQQLLGMLLLELPTEFPIPITVAQPTPSPALPLRLRFALPSKETGEKDTEEKALPIPPASFGRGSEAIVLTAAVSAAFRAAPEGSGVTPKPADAPEIPLAPPAVRAEAGSLQSGELAFAAKLTPKTTLVHAAEPVHREEVPDALIAPPIVPRVAEIVAVPEALSQPRHDAAPIEHKTELRETPRPILEAPPEPSAAKPLESLRDISLKLTDSKQEQVEVRLLERSGELHVSVRSSDTQLNVELRSGLGDLAGKLEKTGFQAETWHPQIEKPTAPAESSQAGNSRQQNPEQNPERRNPRHPRRSTPKWVEEIGNNFSTGDQH